MALLKTLPNGQTLSGTIVGDNVIWVNYDSSPQQPVITPVVPSLEQLQSENAELKARIADLELAFADILAGGVA